MFQIAQIVGLSMLFGFACGYSVREFISMHRHAQARRSRSY
jgi:hypothetical protein